MLQIYDANGNPIQAVPLGFTMLSRTPILQGTTTYTVPAGCRAILIECIGSGGAGGGAATSSANCSLGGGGGSGSYSATWKITPKLTAFTVAVGAGGTAGAAGAAGNNGNDTTFDSASICTGKAGGGGGVLAAGTTLVTQAGGAGGLASGAVGDIKHDGSQGGWGVRLSASTGQGGDGGDAPIGGGSSAGANATVTPGNVGKQYGGGGSGAFTATTAQVGGAGANGVILVTEFA